MSDPHLQEVAHWHPIEGTPEKKRVAIGCSVGAVIETYDFIGFGTAAALYFGQVFFPESDPLSATLLSFATLGIGFAVRPLGGVIGGYLGDKIGHTHARGTLHMHQRQAAGGDQALDGAHRNAELFSSFALGDQQSPGHSRRIECGPSGGQGLAHSDVS